ncbi:MAG TPA: HepT-like ribonuclease domain-containing protein [Hyphomicrobium sp.]|nr:HepT-like ribonuclease domain-containing protein [Hyphomicrobium sp.]
MDAAMRFVEGRNRSDLESDEMLLFALVRAIEIVGEAASKMSDEARAEMPELPWASIVGMRHRLVHAYFEINRDILWTTVTEAVPPLAEHLKALLKDE